METSMDLLDKLKISNQYEDMMRKLSITNLSNISQGEVKVQNYSMINKKKDQKEKKPTPL